MNSRVLLSTCLVVLMGAAEAANLAAMPTPFHGKWLIADGRPAADVCAKHEMDAILVVNAKQIESYENHCFVRSVKGDNDSVSIAADCAGEGESYKLKYRMTISGNGLLVETTSPASTRKHSQAYVRCADSPAKQNEKQKSAATYYTLGKEIEFVDASSKLRKTLMASQAAELVEGDFMIATEDLDDDGNPELILMGSGPWCGSGGCSVHVLEKRGNGYVTLLSGQSLDVPLYVTNEKVGRFRALAMSDGKSSIAVGDRRGTPLYGKQMVYPMKVR